MSCGNYNSGGGALPAGHCVADVVKRIVKAQHRAVRAEEDTCLTSCDRSIADLLTEFEPNRRRLRHNTIPFILFCKEACKPFVGSGIVRKRFDGSDHSKFVCIESPIFRVKNFVDGSDNCVVLELLKPVSHSHGSHSHGHSDKDLSPSTSSSKGCHGSICSHFDGKKVTNFRATDICITVDLNCFCGISCLDPVTPLRSVQSDDDC